ncbi:MAG: hypothetical protein DWP92_05180 [Armatimonadetes bacterium]|nr:MAG: hypothetical protein DWP92_05180 [Armatimonadota bacterium]
MSTLVPVTAYSDDTGWELSRPSFEPLLPDTTLMWDTDRADASLRFLCHVLVHAIPRQGLREAIESLSTMIEFYDDSGSQPSLTHSTKGATREVDIGQPRPSDPFSVDD